MEFRRYAPRHLLLIALPVLAAAGGFAWFFASELENSHRRRDREELLSAARELVAVIELHGGVDAASARLLAASEALRAQRIAVLVLDPDGTIVLNTPSARPAAVDALVELAAARRGEAGVHEYPAQDGLPAVLGVALPYAAGAPDRPGLVRLERALHAPLADAGTRIRLAIVVIVLAGGATLTLAMLQARRFARLVLHLTRACRRLAAGDDTVRADLVGSRELRLLSLALDEMRERLVGHAQTIDRQRRILESLLAQLREGVIVVGADGNVALINPAAVRLLNIGTGPEAESLVGLAVERCIPQMELQRLLNPAVAAGAAESRDERHAAGAAESGLADHRLQVQTGSGTIHLLAHVCDIHLPTSSEGEGTRSSTGRLLVLTDITALTRTIQIKTDFVANASHELRTPLSTIMAAVETLQRLEAVEQSEPARKFVELIERHSRRLEALATDLLELSRLEADPERFKPRFLNVVDVLDDVRSEFSARARSRRVELVTEVNGLAAPTIHANPQLLRLVLDNLVDNAVKFSEPETAVKIRVRRDGQSVTFEVEDQGCGIPPEEQERVFERFYQTQRSRSGPERGTGLGLSIVRHAVNAMRGTVRLWSKPGVGTRVTVTIPQGD